MEIQKFKLCRNKLFVHATGIHSRSFATSKKLYAVSQIMQTTTNSTVRSIEGRKEEGEEEKKKNKHRDRFDPRNEMRFTEHWGQNGVNARAN